MHLHRKSTQWLAETPTAQASGEFQGAGISCRVLMGFGSGLRVLKV